MAAPPPLGPYKAGSLSTGNTPPPAPALGKYGSSGGSKGGGGILGSVMHGVGGVLGVVGNVLQAPQQMLYQGVKDIRQGKLLASGVPGDPAAHVSFSQAVGVKKLPYGLNTAAEVVTDPLNFVALGTPAAAKAALAKVSEVGGEQLAKDIAEQGAKRALTGVARDEIRSALVQDALDTGVKGGSEKAANKFADKTLRELDRAGQGGIRLKVPGTTLSKSVVTGEQLGEIGERTGLTAIRDQAVKSRPVQVLRDALVSGARVKNRVGEEAGSALKTELRSQEQKAAEIIHDNEAKIRAAVKSVPHYGAEEDRIVQAALESGDLASAIATHPHLEPVMNALDEVRQGLTVAQVRRGVLSEDAIHNTDTYLKRVLTPEGKKAVRAANRTGGLAEADRLVSSPSLEGSLAQRSAQARRLLPEMTVPEVNEAVRSGAVGAESPGLQKLAENLPQGADLFREEAVGPSLLRNTEAAHAIASADVVKNVGRITDHNGDQILMSAEEFASTPPRYAKGWTDFEIRKLGKFHAPKEVAEEIKSTLRVLNADPSVAGFDRFMNGWTRFWKTHATSFPVTAAFTSRNARSNLFLNYLAGVTDPRVYVRAGRIQKAAFEVAHLAKFREAVLAKGFEGALREVLSESDFKLYQAAREHGIIGAGFSDVDLAGKTRAVGVKGVAKEGSLAGRAVKQLGAEGVPARAGAAVNQAVEHNARLAHFAAMVDKTGSFDQAALSVKKYLFDYGDLTPFEQRRLKAVIPFYTFLRKNTPLQFERLMMDPGKFALRGHIASAMTQEPPKGSPDYLVEQGGRGVNSKLANLLGMAKGGITTPDDPLSTAVQSVTPLVHLATGLMPGKQGQLEPTRGIGQAAGELGSTLSGPQLELYDQLTQLATGKSLFTGGYVSPKGPDQVKALLTSQIPSIGKVPAGIPLGVLPKKKLNKSALAEMLRAVSGLTVTQPK